MRHDLINPIRACRFPVLIKKHFFHYFLNILVFFPGNYLFIAVFCKGIHFQWMILLHFLIILQKLYRVPADGRMIGITGLHSFFQFRKLLLHLFSIIQDILFRAFLVMVHNRMHENIKARPPCRGNRHYRDIPQHFGQTVQIDFHPPFLHDIHHV